MNLYDIPTANDPHKPQTDGSPGHVVGSRRFHRRYQCRLDFRLQQVELHAHALIYGDAPHLHLAALQEEAQHIARTAPSGGWIALGVHAKEIDREIENIWSEPITADSAMRVLPQLERLLTEGELSLRQG